MIRNALSKISHHEYYGHILFLSVWLILNLFQAASTELAHDESYYWMYSRILDWGYFDHPPMVAFLVNIGYAMFQNELGARFFFVLMGGGTLFLIYQLLPKNYKNIPFYYLVVFSIILVNAHFAGFLAIPDIPLIFFSTLFLFFYKKYLEDEKISYALFLGILAAAMIYSKYHSVLVIFFIVLSNFSLFRKKNFYLAIITAAALLVPHLLWQMNHGFPTFTYHLVERSSSYKPLFTWNYIYSQLLLTGPLIGVFLLFFAFKKKPTSTFEKSLKYLMVGFFIFFFFMSFKGRVEAHWLAAAYIPLIVFSVVSIEKTKTIKKVIYILGFISIGLILTARIFLASNKLAEKAGIQSQFHHWEKWADKIAEKAAGRPVIFINKYQYPSKYTFYSGEFSTALSSIYYHKTQFDLWNFEDSLQGKEVLLTKTSNPTDTIYTRAQKEIRYEVIDNFQSFFNSVTINVNPTEMEIAASDSIDVMLNIINNKNEPLSFDQNPDMPSHLCYSIFSRGKAVDVCKKIDFHLPELGASDTIKTRATLSPVGKTGNFQLLFSIHTSKLLPAKNGGSIDLEIHD